MTFSDTKSQPGNLLSIGDAEYGSRIFGLLVRGERGWPRPVLVESACSQAPSLFQALLLWVTVEAEPALHPTLSHPPYPLYPPTLLPKHQQFIQNIKCNES
jgi:hypothetical protein